MKIDKEKLTPFQAAVLHHVKGALDSLDIDVPAGTPHKIAGYQVTFTASDFALVSRAEGINGDGTDPGKPKPLALTLNAVLLAIAASGAKIRSDAWAQAIRDDLAGAKAKEPESAASALEMVQSEMPEEVPPPRRTPAKRVGEKEVVIEIRKRAVAA